MTRISILYHSRTGTTEKMAMSIAEGMRSVEGVEVKTQSIAAIDQAFLKDSAGVVLGTPTYLASMSAETKTWLDTVAVKSGLAGKLAGAFATADYLHGGADNAIQAILCHCLVLGMLAYSGGGAFGKPVIHFGPVALKDRLGESEDVFRLYGRRFAGKAKELAG